MVNAAIKAKENVMKKILSFLLIALLSLSLISCGSTTSESKSNDTDYSSNISKISLFGIEDGVVYWDVYLSADTDWGDDDNFMEGLALYAIKKCIDDDESSGFSSFNIMGYENDGNTAFSWGGIDGTDEIRFYKDGAHTFNYKLTSDQYKDLLGSVTSDDQSSTSDNQPSVYPLEMTSTLLDSAIEAPATIFSTRAAENGLSGTAYYITGTVTESYADGSSPTGKIYFTVSSDNGKIAFINMMDYADTSNYSEEEIASAKNIYSSGYNNDFPSVGQYVTVYGLYLGYSEVLKMPVLYYGLNEETQKILLQRDSQNAVSENPSNKDTDSSNNSTDTKEETSTTIGQDNALKSAKEYLKTSSFSYSGLVEQLKYEGFSTDEATYAVDNCGADWNEQVAQAAQDYLDIMSFSRSELIDQLVYDGFSKDQAEYGVSAAGY